MIIQLVRSRTEPLPPDALQWQKEVYHGNTKEIVSVRLRGSYVNMEFLKAVEVHIPIFASIKSYNIPW